MYTYSCKKKKKVGVIHDCIFICTLIFPSVLYYRKTKIYEKLKDFRGIKLFISTLTYTDFIPVFGYSPPVIRGNGGTLLTPIISGGEVNLLPPPPSHVTETPSILSAFSSCYLMLHIFFWQTPVPLSHKPTSQPGKYITCMYMKRKIYIIHNIN